jgi:hypothetical protein
MTTLQKPSHSMSPATSSQKTPTPSHALADVGMPQLESSVLRHAKFSSVALDFVLEQWQLIASASVAPANTT